MKKALIVAGRTGGLEGPIYIVIDRETICRCRVLPEKCATHFLRIASTADPTGLSEKI